MRDRRRAELRVGLARLWARAKQIVTTDPSPAGDDDAMVDEAAARTLAAHAGRLKGGLAKVAQLAAYDPAAALGGARGGEANVAPAGRAVLSELWDRAPPVDSASVAAVIEAELGRSPEALFARWDPEPLAAASLGQVHAAELADGTRVVVKVQYPGIAEALRADLDDADFVRKLVGAGIGPQVDEAAIAILANAVRGELDYRAEAAAQARFADAWRGHAVLRVPTVIAELSSARVITMTRAPGRAISAVSAMGSPTARSQAALAVLTLTWGSPLVHRLLNADPNPGNFLVEELPDGGIHLWCLDFGCAREVPVEMRDADRELWWAILEEDSETAAERFRMGLAASGLLRRADSLATAAHREWERRLAEPFTTHGSFHWGDPYARALAEATGRVLSAGGIRVPPELLLLWRQRLGAAAVIGMLDARAPFRRTLHDLIGSGRRALR